MDINILPTFGIVWLKNTLPTYSLDISPNFCSFFGPCPKCTITVYNSVNNIVVYMIYNIVIYIVFDIVDNILNNKYL